MKTFLLLLIASLCIDIANAQLETGEKRPDYDLADPSAIKVAIEQSRLLINTDRDKAKSLAAQAFRLATGKKNAYWSAMSLLAVADAGRFTGNIDKLLADEKSAIAYAAKSRNNVLLFDCLNAHALDLIALSRFDEATTVMEREKNLPDDVYDQPDHKAKLLNAQGYYVLRQQKNMTEAKVFLNQSLAVANETGNLYLIAKNKLFLFRAMLLSAVRDSTANYIFDALTIFQKNGYPEEEANCNIEIANSYRFLADLNKSSEYAQIGYDIMESHQNHLGAGAALSILFQDYYFQNKTAEAKKAVDGMSNHYTALNFEQGIGTTDMCYGAWYSANKEYAKADAFFKKADEIADHLQLSPLKAALSMFESVHYQAQNKTKEADSAALKGYALTQKVLPKELLGNMYSSKDSAKLSASQALDKRLFNDSIFREQHGREALEAVRKANGGEPIYKPILSVYDSGLNSAYNKQLTEIETRYKTKQKDDSLLIAKQQSIAYTATIQKQNVFITSVAVIALLLAAGFFLQYKNRRRAERDKAKIETLQKEIYHRVENNLAVLRQLVNVSGEASHVSADTLQNRISAIELLHARLYQDNLIGSIFLQRYLTDLSQAIADVYTTEKDIRVSANAPVEISSKTAERLGLIVNEVVANSFKYAFDNRKDGSIRLEASAIDDKNNYRLTIADNGKGFIPAKNEGYGMKLITGLAHELNGRVSYENNNGTLFILYFTDLN